MHRPRREGDRHAAARSTCTSTYHKAVLAKYPNLPQLHPARDRAVCPLTWLFSWKASLSRTTSASTVWLATLSLSLAPNEKNVLRQFVGACEVAENKIGNFKQKVVACRKSLRLIDRESSIALGFVPRGEDKWKWNESIALQMGTTCAALAF